MPVPHAHIKKLEQVHREGQIPRDVVENETDSHPVERESSLNPGERRRNFCTMVCFWKVEMRARKKK